MRNRIIVFLAAVISMMYSEAYARWDFDIGTGAVFSGYNDVRIPNRSGTDISLSEELETEPDYFLTVRITHSIDNKHNLSVFAAPLRLTANGKVNKTVKFEGEEFSANIPLTAVYRFDSYRLTYRYDFHRGRNFQAGFGFTAKIRDASISLKDGGKSSEKKNVGFVPLINFRAQWILSNRLSILLDGDALGPGEEGWGQLRLEEPAGARARQRIVLRSYSPVETFAGARVVEPFPPKRRRRDAALGERMEAVLGGDPARALEAALELAGIPGVPEPLRARSVRVADEIDAALHQIC